MPKSATFTRPSLAIRMLAGLMSRWTTPFLWANPRAEATSMVISDACCGLSLPLAFRMSARVRPGTYSMAMK